MTNALQGQSVKCRWPSLHMRTSNPAQAALVKVKAPRVVHSTAAMASAQGLLQVPSVLLMYAVGSCSPAWAAWAGLSTLTQPQSLVRAACKAVAPSIISKPQAQHTGANVRLPQVATARAAAQHGHPQQQTGSSRPLR